MTLIADVATSYVNLRTAEERIRVAIRNADAQKESQRVAEAKFKEGNPANWICSKPSRSSGKRRRRFRELQNTVNQTKNGLAVLLGTTPDDVDRYLTGSKESLWPPPPWRRVFPRSPATPARCSRGGVERGGAERTHRGVEGQHVSGAFTLRCIRFFLE